MENKIQKEVAIAKVKKSLEELDDRIAEAPGLFGKGIISIDEITVLINKISNDVPSEFDEAIKIIKDKNEILDRANAMGQGIVEQANAQAEKIIAAAQAESERLVSDTYVFKKAEEKASQMIDEAQRTSFKAIEYANEYTTNIFNQMLGAVDYFQKEIDDKRAEIFNKLQTEQREYQFGSENSYYNQEQFNNYQNNNEEIYSDDSLEEEYSD